LKLIRSPDIFSNTFAKQSLKDFKKRYQKDALYLINIKKKMMVQKKDILTQYDKNKNKITPKNFLAVFFIRLFFVYRKLKVH